MTKSPTEKSIDLLEKMTPGEKQTPRSYLHSILSYTGKFFFFFGIIFILMVVIFTYKVVFSANSVIASSNGSSFLKQLRHLTLASDKMIRGEDDDRTNLLLLGIGGEGHSGGYLADTIILASIKPSTRQVALLSIPRDLYFPIPGYDWRKINNGYAFGFLKDRQEGGEKLMLETIENLTGLPIHYYGRIDFSGFRKIIDDLGGIDVFVERGFTDGEYPTTRFGWQTIAFREGWSHFNGERALQFARSRHGNNGEGSDFARSKRQQKILSAIKEKILSVNTLLNPSMIFQLLNDLGKHVRTSLEPWEIMKLYALTKNLDSSDIIHRVLENHDGPLHAETTIDGAYILRPNRGPDDFSEIQTIAKEIFDTPSALIQEEPATIEIQNGTPIRGLAHRAAQQLESSRLDVRNIRNARRRDYDQTVLYDLTQGKKPLALAALKEKLDALIVTTLPASFYPSTIDSITYEGLTAPLDLENTPPKESVDFLIIVGENAN